LETAGIVAVLMTQDEGNRTRARAEGCAVTTGASWLGRFLLWWRAAR
jgi:hypothetical protein